MSTYATAVTRGELNSGNLQTWLNRQTLKNFEPNLYFWQFGEKPINQSGYNTLAWAKFTRLASSVITAGAADGTEDGVSPTPIAFNSVVISTTPVQYRAVVSISDLVAELNVIDFIKGAIIELGHAMARKIDEVIQTTVMAGNNVIYGGSKTARTALTTSDILTAALFNKADAFLQAKNAPTIDGHYVAIVHPFPLADLRSETGTGNWIEVNKYAAPEKIFNGEIGMLNGVRIVVSSYVQSFTSTATVYPTLVLGQGAYGVASFQSLRTFVVPFAASDSDPVAQRSKISVKIAFGSIILQQDAMVRIETGSGNILF